MNLVLTGYRGSGKSTLSALLGDRLNMPVDHMDEILEARLGMRIAAFVEERGWEAFRGEESLLAAELGAMDGRIVDTGGGVVTRPQNIAHLRRNGFVVWLRAEPEYMAQFIRNDSNRPSLTGVKSAVDEIREVLAVREPLYRSAADFTVRTDRHSLDECADRIERAWLASAKSP